MMIGLRVKIIGLLTTIFLIPVILLTAGGAASKGTDSMNTETMALNFGALLVIAFMAFFVCAWLLTRLISRRVLAPLHELTAAAERFMEGNLDASIRYRNPDEMGRFCAAFEMMRVQLKQSLEAQAAYEQSRKVMIASISHDLRTPITSIKGYVEGLQDGFARDPEKFSRYLAVIKNKTVQLDKRIEDLFHFSQLELGHVEMVFNEQNFAEMFETIVKPIETELKDRAVAFTVERPFPMEPVNADRDRVEQVLGNLVDNAIKHGGENGSIEMKTTVEGNVIRISIRDNGVGIPEVDMPYIFDRFYRGEKSRSREYGGSGLGLAICKQIVQDHGGNIGVQSESGKGTVFFFTLPIANTQGRGDK